MTRVTFNYITDPGHGWLQVSSSFIDALGITPQISRYSYAAKRSFTEGWICYLEEDCDMPLFLCAFHARWGYWPKINEVRPDPCLIRNMDPYPWTVDSAADFERKMKTVSEYYAKHGRAA
jgi:hypothetical protein